MVCRRAPNAQVIQVSGVTTQGPVGQEDRPLVDASGAETLRRVTVAIVPTVHFEAAPIARHATAVVGASRYTVRDVRAIDDGELTELVLAAVVA